MYSKKYEFTEGNSIPEWKGKNGGTEEAGCGFLHLNTRWESMDHYTGTGGWVPGKGAGEIEGLLQPEWREAGAESRSDEIPVIFRAEVPSTGVYKVSVCVKAGSGSVPDLRLYTNRRNLVRRSISIEDNGEFNCQFYVNVCEYIPVMGKPPVLDQAVYVTMLGRGARLAEVTIKESQAPTVYVGGDSLVADYPGQYPYNPLINGGSWGQNILQYFDGMAVNNQAHGGMTTNCFRDDGHWDIICRNLCPGDVFLFEFGHNDQKRRNLKAFDQYAANLRWYISQVRKMGGFPVIVTSLSRIPGRDSRGYFDLLEDYAESCRRTGRELQVPVIDLHEYSFRLMCEMGTEKCRNYFNDVTHTNDYGAIMMADYVAEEIRRLMIRPMCSAMNNYRGKQWIPDESLRPINAPSSADKPEKPILSTDLPELPYADCRHIPQLPVLKEAMAKGLLDPCLKYFHPFEEIPRGQFLYLFFKASPSPAKQSYQGKYCDIYKYEFDASNVQAAIEAELIDETTTPLDRFRPDDGLTGGELISFIVRSLHNTGDRGWNKSQCEQQAKSLGLLWQGYEKNKAVNRADCTQALVHMMNLTKEQRDALPINKMP